jgi:DNA (cytosine-5)-methyltransferase 1
MDSKKTSGDITKIEDTQFQIYRGKADIIFAGFPCQGFSHAGKKATTDPRNQLYQQFVRATKEIRPLFIIGENVQGLARMKSGPNATDPLMLDCIKTAFEAIGYMLTYKIQEVTAFGVPQKRKRVVIVGWDTSRVKNFQPTKMWTVAEQLGSAKTTPILRSFVTNTMEGAYLVPKACIPEDFGTYALEVPQNAEPTGTPHPYVVLKTDTDLLSCTKRVSPIHSEIIDLDAPSKTIICTYGHQPRLLIGLKKPDGTAYVRTMLPNELKQIQGFPANYKLKGTQSEQVIQIGNAVPPPMIECVAQALRQFT